MNLMFWKKKPEAGNDAEDAQEGSSMNKKERESLDVAAATQDSTESNQESPNPESPEQDTPVKTGLVARMRSKLTSVTRHFSKTPAFQAGEDYASDANNSSKSAPNDAPAIESDPKSADPETPAKPGLVAQIKSQLAALILRFKKAPAPDAEEDQDKDTHRRSKDDSEKTEETPGKPSLVAKIKSRLAALTLRFKKTPAPDTEEDQDKDTRRRSKDDSEDAEETQEKLGLIKRVKLNLVAFVSHYKWFLIFTLLLLSLIYIVYAAWDIIFPPLVRKPALHSMPKPLIQEPSPPEEPLTEAEALKKKSEEAQARAEALKKESEEAQLQAETLMKESAAAQARAEELRKKEEEEKALAEIIRKKGEEEKARVEALKKKEVEEKARAEALRKKEAADKARVEALKKSPRQQQSLDPSIGQTGGSAASPLISGEITVDSKDPKATAKSLKEAIEAMNTGSDGTSKKPAK